MNDPDDLRQMLAVALADEPRPPTADQIAARAILERDALARRPLRWVAALAATAVLVVAMFAITRRQAQPPASPVRTPDRIWVAAHLPAGAVLLDVNDQLPTPGAIGISGHGGRVVFRRDDPASILQVDTVISATKVDGDDGRRIELRDGNARLDWPEQVPNDSLGLYFWRDGLVFDVASRGVLPDEIAAVANALSAGDGSLAEIDPSSGFREVRREPYGQVPISAYRITYGQLDIEPWFHGQVDISRYAEPVDAQLGLSIFAEPLGAATSNAWVDDHSVQWQPQPDTIVRASLYRTDSPLRPSDLVEITRDELQILAGTIGDGLAPTRSWRAELPGGPVTLDWIGFESRAAVGLICTTGVGARRCRLAFIGNLDGVLILEQPADLLVDDRWLLLVDHGRGEPEIKLPVTTTDDGRWDIFEVPAGIDTVVLREDSGVAEHDRAYPTTMHRPTM